MTHRCLVIALLTLIAGCRFTEEQEKAKPTSHSSAAPKAKRPIPTITFERFEGNDQEYFAVFRFGNPSAKAIYFQGYDAEWPQLWIQRRDGDRWKDAGWHWCGTGMDLHELPTGTSVEFHVSLTEQSDFREPMDKSLLDHRQPIRVGTYYGFNHQKIEKRVWSDTVRLDTIFQFTSGFVEEPPPEQTPGLIRELKNEDVVQRRRAVILLWAVCMRAQRDSEAPSDGVIDALWQATNDRDTDVRKTALLTLSILAPDDARLLSLILAIFKNEDPSVRETAINCVSELGPRAAPAVPTLIRELNDDYADLADDELTNQLVDVLGQIGPKAEKAIPVLLRILADESLPMNTRSRAAASRATLAEATIESAYFGGGLAADQLYETASYQRRNLPEIGLSTANLSNWDLSDQNLRGSILNSVTSNSTNLARADLCHASIRDSDLTEATGGWWSSAASPQ